MNKERASKLKYEDFITNKIILAFATAAAVLFGFHYYKKGLASADYAALFRKLGVIAVILAAVVAAAAAVLHIVKMRNGGYGKYRVLTWRYLCVTACFCVLALSFISYNYDEAMRFLYMAIPIAAILYLVYYSYPRVMFAFSFIMAVTGVSVYYQYKFPHGTKLDFMGTRAFVLSLAFAALFLVLYFVCRKNKGTLKIGSRSADLFGDLPVWGALALTVVSAAVNAAARIAGTAFCYYTVFALCGVILTVMIYYTVRQF